MRMMVVCLAVLALLAGAGFLSAVNGTSAAIGQEVERKPPSGNDVHAGAERFVQMLVAGDFGGAAAGFDEAMKNGLPVVKLQETWNALTQQVGSFQRQTGVVVEEEEGYRIVYVTCAFERAPLDVKVVFDESGRIAGLFFQPPHSPEPPRPDRPPADYRLPDYARQEAFREREVTVGAGRWSLPGSLLLPSGKGPFPGLVLVHGSGPQDRDETIGPNKPFRDLASGLASWGVVVLRYDKRTLARRAEVAALGDRLTLQEETIDDAVAAVAGLRARQEVDGRRIFVLGHSLGGVAVPRIAALDPRIAGFVLMATPSRPLEQTILEQATYLASLDGTLSDEEKAGLAELKQEIARLHDPSFPTAADPGALPLGLSRAYWLDLRKDTGPAAMALLRQPLLVLQGGRDCQVTLDDFRGWKGALAVRTGVEFKLYPGLNHLFIKGEGKSTPAEYEVPGHVARTVVDDLAGWVAKQPAGGAPPRR